MFVKTGTPMAEKVRDLLVDWILELESAVEKKNANRDGRNRFVEDVNTVKFTVVQQNVNTKGLRIQRRSYDKEVKTWQFSYHLYIKPSVDISRGASPQADIDTWTWYKGRYENCRVITSNNYFTIPEMTYTVSGGTLNPTDSLIITLVQVTARFCRFLLSVTLVHIA